MNDEFGSCLHRFDLHFLQKNNLPIQGAADMALNFGTKK
jgi:hypothetical protein